MASDESADNQGSSTRPYLLRALHDWCTDNGFTPYVAVFVDDQVRVPLEYVKNQEIVLNVGFEATSGLKLGNEFIEFRARFGGTPRDIVVPVDHVVAIYARENGQGMAFPAPTASAASAADAADATPTLRLAKTDTEPDNGPDAAPSAADDGGKTPPEPPAPAPTRPTLKRVK